MTIISISETAKEKVHRCALVAAQALLGVGLGCAMWWAIGDLLTFTVRHEITVPTVQIAQAETPAFDPSTVPDALAELYEINPDARRFVTDYADKHDLHPAIDLSPLADCDAVPRLYQWDERWGYEQYNENFFARAGCGPTCLSMVDIYLTGSTDHDPLWMARFAEEHGYNEVGNGTKWALFSEGAGLLGMRAEGITISPEYIAETLAQGIPIVCIMGPGDFTDQGHYLVLTGIDADGNITLNDPNSRTRSERTWTYEELQPQMRGGWKITKDSVA